MLFKQLSYKSMEICIRAGKFSKVRWPMIIAVAIYILLGKE